MSKLYPEMQFEVRKMYAMLWHAKITSGAYKLRELYHGTSGPEFTDEEKLEDALDTMKRHIELMNETAEYIAGLDES